MTLDTNKIIKILKNESLRITQSRIAVAKILIENRDSYLTTEDIYQKILVHKKMSCDQASVYRTLAKFEQMGIVQKNNFRKDASRYKINDNFGTQSHHKHFFKCIKCFTI